MFVQYSNNVELLINMSTDFAVSFSSVPPPQFSLTKNTKELKLEISDYHKLATRK
jgi:hypothetical protein